jgi:PAS domain S-box-containing protein
LVLPIGHERELTGLITLGPKLSGDPYFSSDIELLVTVTNQAGIVLQNATLYHEVKTVKEHTEEILRNMESGLVAVNGNGIITTVNAVAETLLGSPASSFQGKPMDTLPSTLAAPLAGAVCEGHRSFQSEAQLLAQNGRIVSIVLSTSMIRDSEGHILRAILVFSDHSKIKELEREKRRAERLTAFQALASGVAHEIKNPLVAIKTFAELLPERFTEKDFREEFSAVVIREIDRIDALVARLRGLATPVAQPLMPLDLRIPIEETLALLRGQIEQARITVKSTYECELPLVNGDNAQLKQLFLNLFMNALEAMEPGGKLLVRLTTGEDSGSPTLMVKVSDTGTGIPDALLGKIFDPFVTTKPGGSGLGLSICRGIADAHRATIRANNNTEGSGTTIEIGFPTVSISRVALKT